jgi:hypothetical protein
MKCQRHWSEFELWHTDDQLLTDSMVLSKKHVDSVFDNFLDDQGNSPDESKGILNSLILSRREDLLFWILIVLTPLIF